MNLYHSVFAGPHRATAVTWAVGDDVEGVVRELRDKGVHFKHYDMRI